MAAFVFWHLHSSLLFECLGQHWNNFSQVLLWKQAISFRNKQVNCKFMCVIELNVFFRFAALALAKTYYCPGSVKYPWIIPIMFPTPDYNKTQLNAIKIFINAILVLIGIFCAEIRIWWSFNQEIRLFVDFVTNLRQFNCLFHNFFGLTQIYWSKSSINVFSEGNLPVTSAYPSRRINIEKSVPISLFHIMVEMSPSYLHIQIENKKSLEYDSIFFG